MFTISLWLYVTLFCLKKSPLNFTFNLALRYIRLVANLLLLDGVVELIFSLVNPFHFHEQISKYLYTAVEILNNFECHHHQNNFCL